MNKFISLKAQKKAAFIFSRNKFMEDYEETLMAKIRLEIDEAKSADIQITHMLLGEEDIAEHWVKLLYFGIHFKLYIFSGLLGRRNRSL